ncbi:hypothetical protein M3J09_003069 [Ascochyta lentis]
MPRVKLYESLQDRLPSDIARDQASHTYDRWASANLVFLDPKANPAMLHGLFLNPRGQSRVVGSSLSGSRRTRKCPMKAASKFHPFWWPVFAFAFAFLSFFVMVIVLALIIFLIFIVRRGWTFFARISTFFIFRRTFIIFHNHQARTPVSTLPWLTLEEHEFPWVFHPVDRRPLCAQ